MPTSIKANWLNVPKLEARIKAADKAAPCLTTVYELTKALAEALETDVRPEISVDGTALNFAKGSLVGGSVVICGNRYRLSEAAGPELLETVTRSTEEIVWKVCGYGVTPAKWRSLAKKAARDGYGGDWIPMNYFIPRMTRFRWKVERFWPAAGQWLRRFDSSVR